MKSQLFLEFIPKSWFCFSKKYTTSMFKSDLLSGMTVGVVALPLAMAFAIASGLSPERGLYTAIIAGFLISLLGGSRYQIGGPTGAFVVIIYDIMSRVGYEGLVCITFLAGLVLVGAALCRVGTWIKYVPYPLVTGFTTGIAVLIFSSQIKDLVGLKIAELPAAFIPQWKALLMALPTLSPVTCGVGVGTLSIILLLRKFCPRIPWGIAAVLVATLVSYGLQLPVDTIATKFGEIPKGLPSFHFPNLTHVLFHLSQYLPDIITVAFLAGIESLLSAVVADGMTGGRHRANMELMGQGVANMASAVWGGIPATGAIARTATNIKTGAKSPVSGMIHALTLLCILLFLAPYVSLVPLAALSAVLVVVAWNMAELHHFRHLLNAPKGDIVILLATFFLTLFVDLTVAVAVGMGLAAFIFMKRMGDVFGVVKPSSQEERQEEAIPKGVELYEIRGPLFFGVASSLKMILSNLEPNPRVVILRMRDVPLLDASGMHALEEIYDQCLRDKSVLMLIEVPPRLIKKLEAFEFCSKIGKENICASLKEALQKVEVSCYL